MAVAAKDGFVVKDAIALPAPGDAVVGRAAREAAYPVHVCRTAAQAVARLEELRGSARTVAVVTDETVEALYGRLLTRALREGGAEVLLRAVPAGERSKSLEQAVGLLHWLADGPVGRRDLIVTFGGGVVHDMGGWVAGTYMRGIPYVNVPTTLLAMVDGALGGKVAVNHPAAKNLLGSFCQPAGVVANVAFLGSLDRRHLSAGLAECVKKAVIASPDYLAFLEAHAEALLDRDLDALTDLVRAAAAIKLALIERDPYEDDLRRPLNFGHTVGHPVETVSGYGPLLHGEAVAFGMVVEARIATARGLFPEDELERLLDLLRRCRLPTSGADLPVALTAAPIVEAMEKVRLIRAGSLRYVLPRAAGETVIADDVTPAELHDALAASGVYSDRITR